MAMVSVGLAVLVVFFAAVAYDSEDRVREDIRDTQAARMAAHGRCQVHLDTADATCFFMLLPHFIAVESVASTVAMYSVQHMVGSVYYHASCGTFDALVVTSYFVMQNVSYYSLLTPEPYACASLTDKVCILLLITSMLYRAELLRQHRHIAGFVFEVLRLSAESLLLIHLLHSRSAHPVGTLLMSFTAMIPVNMCFCFVFMQLTPLCVQVANAGLMAARWFSLCIMPLYGTMEYISLQQNGAFENFDSILLTLATAVIGVGSILFVMKNFSAMFPC